MTALIEVRGLTKRFGSKTVVDDLSFTVTNGRVTGFLGPNGSGKSTTMRCMLGLDRAHSGTTLFNGRPYTSVARPIREVGALLDAGYVHPGRSARNHLRYLAASNGLNRRRVDEVLTTVGLDSVASKRVGTFSLGMKQRLGIATALLGNPEILMFDEPVNGLDPEGIHWMRQLMRVLASEGRAVLVSSHLLSEMAQTADDLVIIGQGRLISAGPVDAFITANVESWVTVRSPTAARLATAVASIGGQVRSRNGDEIAVVGVTAAQVGEAAAASSIVLHELSTQRASLEEAFLKATAPTVDFRAVPLPARSVPVGPSAPPGSPLPPPTPGSGPS